MIRKIVNFVVYTNIWISLAALSCGVQVYILFEKEINPYILAILFGGTLSRYNYIVFSLKKGSFSEKFSFMFLKRKAAILFFLFGGIVSGYGMLNLSIKEFLFITHLIIVSSLYFTTIKTKFFKVEKLRNWPYTKVFVIAYVWVGVTFYFPLIEQLHFEPKIVLSSIERFFFFLGITLPFDVRDVNFDKKTKVKTLATKYGENITNYVGSICLLLSAGISMYVYSGLLSVFLSVSYILFIPLVLYSSSKSKELHFTGLLDGTMVVQLLLLLIVLIF